MKRQEEFTGQWYRLASLVKKIHATASASPEHEKQLLAAHVNGQSRSEANDLLDRLYAEVSEMPAKQG